MASEGGQEQRRDWQSRSEAARASYSHRDVPRNIPRAIECTVITRELGDPLLSSVRNRVQLSMDGRVLHSPVYFVI